MSSVCVGGAAGSRRYDRPIAAAIAARETPPASPRRSGDGREAPKKVQAQSRACYGRVSAWPDVHVDVEDVFGIELGLQIAKARVVRAVGDRGGVGFVVIEVVHVPRRPEIRSKRRVDTAAPCNVPVVFLRVHPLRDDDDVVAGDTHRARRIGDGNAAGGAMEVLDYDLAHRRRSRREGVHERTDAVIRQIDQEMRLPVVECAPGD